MVTSSIGDNVVYAAVHEFGGTIHHEARTGMARLHLDARGQLFRQVGNANLAVFAKTSHAASRVKEVAYKAEAYDVEMPERAPFRTGIEEVREHYGRMVSAELVKAWDTHV
jgi:phage gpG-like protein